MGYQRSHEVYHRMEKKMAEAKGPVTLPHCHLTPDRFIKGFKGKIVYISRDVRAVCASAYPFINAMMKDVMEPYESGDHFLLIALTSLLFLLSKEIYRSRRFCQEYDKRGIFHG